MNRKHLIAVACALGVMAIAIPTALAGGAQKVPLSHQVDEFCSGGQIGPLPPETNGFAVIHQVDGNVMYTSPLYGSDLSATKNNYNNWSPSGGFAWTTMTSHSTNSSSPSTTPPWSRRSPRPDTAESRPS